MAIDVTPVPLAYHNRPTRKKLNIVHGRGGSKSGKALGGGGAGDGAALASREVISPDVVGLADEDMQAAVGRETQTPITARGGRAIYQPGSIMDIVTSGGATRANPDYIAAKPIGDDNLPYKPANGIGGWFRRAFMGDTSNTENIRAQQAQGQAWAGEKAAKDAQGQQLAAEDRAFGRQKELFGLQAGENTKRDEATQARQDARDASIEASRMAERDEDAIRDELKAGEAEDRLNRQIEATKALRPPTAYDPDKVYQNDDGSLYNFKRDPMTGKIIKAEVTDKPAFTPPPKGSIPDGPAKAPLVLGQQVPGIVSEVPDSLKNIGRTLVAQTAAPREIVNDVGSQLFGGRLVAEPTALTKAIAHPVDTFTPTPTQDDIEKFLMRLRKLGGGY